jgi:hypothetical protein
MLSRLVVFLSIAPLSALALDSSSKIMAFTAYSEGGKLRTLGDAVVADVTETHVLVVSKTSGDALYVPLLMAWKNLHLRTRAEKEIKLAMDALREAGKPLDDGWHGKNVPYVEKFSPREHEARRSATAAARSNTSNPAAVPVGSAASGGAPLGSSQNSSIADEAQAQLRRFAHDSQRDAMRMQNDAMRQHNRMVEDIQNGADPTGMRNLQRFSEDSATQMNRQANDAHLDAMRGMNDAMRRSGAGAAPAIDPVMPMQEPMFP